MYIIVYNVYNVIMRNSINASSLLTIVFDWFSDI
jgi:hypothetical protein